MRIKKYWFLVLLFGITFKVNAQVYELNNIPNQFWKQRFIYNPAAIGLDQKKVITVSGTAKNGIISLNTFAGYEHPLKNGRTNLGATINYIRGDGFMKDEGVANYQQLECGFLISHGFILGDDMILRLGGQISYKKISYDYWHPIYPKDPETIINVPDLSAGLWFSKRRFFAGISSKQLLRPAFEYQEMKKLYKYRQPVYSYFTVGNTFKLNNNFDWQVSGMYGTDFSKSFFDINNSFIYKDKYTLGVSYSVALFSEIKFNSAIMVGNNLEIGAAASFLTISNSFHSVETSLRYRF